MYYIHERQDELMTLGGVIFCVLLAGKADDFSINFLLISSTHTQTMTQLIVKYTASYIHGISLKKNANNPTS
jgi:hypothetical protein